MQASALHKLTIVEALDSEYLLGASIRDPASFAPWRAFLAVLYGLPLDDGAARDLYTRCTGRVAPPRGPLAGRMAGVWPEGRQEFHHGTGCRLSGAVPRLAAISQPWRDGRYPDRRHGS